jgi:hypothetical protein
VVRRVHRHPQVQITGVIDVWPAVEIAHHVIKRLLTAVKGVLDRPEVHLRLVDSLARGAPYGPQRAALPRDLGGIGIRYA